MTNAIKQFRKENYIPQVVREMTDVRFHGFKWKGQKWICNPETCRGGFGPDGLWDEFTNGTETIVIRKKDVLKRSVDLAAALFNREGR